MDFTGAKVITFAFQIFRCKMQLWQPQIQNKGKNWITSNPQLQYMNFMNLHHI